MPRPKTMLKVPRTGKAGFMGRARVEAEGLMKDARRVGAGVQKRAERAIHDMEYRAERMLGGLEARAVKAIEPMLRKTFATQREMRAVQVKMAELMRKIDALAARSAA